MHWHRLSRMKMMVKYPYFNLFKRNLKSSVKEDAEILKDTLVKEAVT